MRSISSSAESTTSTRWHIDASTLAILERVFAMDQFPNVETRRQLGADLNVSTRQIQVWFQNRRQRERKLKSSSGGLSQLTPSTASPVTSSEDISSALIEFSSTAEEETKRKDAAHHSGIPLAPMPRAYSSGAGAVPGSSDAPIMDPSKENDCDEAGNSMELGIEETCMQEPPLARPSQLLKEAQVASLGWLGAMPPLLPRLSHVSNLGSLAGKGGDQLRPALSSFSPLVGEIGPSVAARLAAACQSTLIGRTLQAYGGIVQVITEARAPYKLLSVSPGWQRLSGWTRDEVVGRTLKLLQGPMTEPDALAALMRGVHTQQPVSLRLTNYTKTGVSFVHQLSCEPLRDPAGETQCFQATSLVLRRPGEAEAAEELAVGHMPTVCRDQVPPLWPLLGSRSLQPEPPQQPAPSADDDFDLFGWLVSDKGEIDADIMENALIPTSLYGGGGLGTTTVC